LQEIGIGAVFPIWKISTQQLVEEFIGLGFKAIIVCVNENLLSKDFCGRLIDASFLQDLPPDVDPCGENGEFHSFVYDGPIFNKPVPFQTGEMVYRKYRAPDHAGSSVDPMDQPSQYGFYFCDLIP
jgi:diphthamide synthase (EF-2-diphthine--ammonia ligase)